MENNEVGLNDEYINKQLLSLIEQTKRLLYTSNQ